MSALYRLSERFWFIPAVLCVAAALLAEALILLGEHSWLPGAFELNGAGASGSRAILTAIAGSSLAVAGTTFSITIAVLALTSSSYGPRLIHNFMADRANQFVLGVYVATFLYSLLVLTSVRPTDGAPGAAVFVPHLAVNFAVALAVLNVGVLIYFIHHVSDSIQISTIARRVRTDLYATIDRLYPQPIHVREQHADGDAEPEAYLEEGQPVHAGRAGYITEIRHEDLVDSAQAHDAVVALKVHPGRYVLDDTVLALIHPTEHADAMAQAVRDAVSVGDARTPWQDISFAVQQLTELAVRALSPAVNDPFTAINALDDLSSALALLARRRMPSPRHLDDTGRMRVHAPYIDVVELTSGVLDHVRWYAPTATSVTHSALDLVHRVGRQTEDEELRDRLRSQVRLLEAAFVGAGRQEHDVLEFTQRADEVLRILREHPGGAR